MSRPGFSRPRIARDDEDLRLERFDYTPITSRWAVVRLVTRMRADVGLPAAPTLLISAAEPFSFPARACTTETRLSEPAGGVSTLWRGAFAVALELVVDPDADFALWTGDDRLMSLPAPARRRITSRTLDLRAPAPARPAGEATAVARRRITAVATAAVLTSTSTPAVALASTVTHRTTSTATASAARKSATTASTTAPSPTTGAGTASMTSTAGATTTATSTPAPSPGAAATTSTPTPTPTPKIATTPASRTTATTVKTAAPATVTPSSTARPAPSTTLTTGGRETATAKRAAAARRAAIAAARRAAAAKRSAAAARAAATAHHATAAGTAATHQAGGERRSAAARRIAILNAGVRQTSDHEHVAARAAHARHHAAVKLAATSRAHTTAAATSGTAVHLLGTTSGVPAPTSWTGIVSAQSSLTGVVRNLAGLDSAADRPPSFLIPIYMEAGRRYHVPWQVLAAINSIESDYGRNLNTSSAGAVGWMQFEPSTWKRWGVAADGVSEANPYDPRDAIFAAARYLQAAGAATDLSKAVFAYNHAGWYVDEVLQRAEAIARHVQYTRARVSHRGAVTVSFDTALKAHPRVSYTSGVLSHYDRLISAANMVSAANFAYRWGGGHEQPARFGPFDCSGSVSYVMQQAGYKVDTTVAADVGAWNLPAGPGRVTIFYSATHTFMRIDGRFFGTSGFARPGGGAGWFDVNRLPASYLAGFREVHVPNLGVDSFSADAAPVLGRAPLTPRAREAARERAGMAAYREARAGDVADQALVERRMIQDLVAHGLHLLQPTPQR